MTERRKVAATISDVWSLEKQQYIPVVGEGDIELNVERINPSLFTEGVLVLVDEAKPKASKQQKPKVEPASEEE